MSGGEVDDFGVCLTIFILEHNFPDMHDGQLKNTFPLSIGTPLAYLCRFVRTLRPL